VRFVQNSGAVHFITPGEDKLFTLDGLIVFLSIAIILFMDGYVWVRKKFESWS